MAPMAKRNVSGPRVRDARRRHVPRLTQADLAARLQVAGCDIDRAGISKIESQIREVDDRELLALARALDVRVGWLLGEDTRER